MAADAVAFLQALIGELSPRHIVEFGSGMSTVALARAAAGLENPGAVTTIENDPAACRAVKTALVSAGVSATIQFAPLVVRRVDGRHLPVYDLRQHRFASNAGADIIIVDGPPSKLGGREGSLRQALSLATVGTIVILDDADRAVDAEVFSSVVRSHRDQLQPVDCDGFDRGLGVFVVTSPVAVHFDDDMPSCEDIGATTATMPAPDSTASG
jgi:predicted O-methyltransferase YrrM